MSTPEIISRQLSKHHQPFSAEEPHFWMDDSDTITEFMHSLSSVFPEGEALFVRSVRAFVACEGVASNAQLLKDVKAFVSQEVQHSAEHASYNKKIEQLYHHDMSSINRYA
jgi:predicted metal-dependent hydrolase